MRKFGLDISKWNISNTAAKSLPWIYMPNYLSFIIIKATQGNYGIDPMAKNHYAGASSLSWKPKIGFYIWHDPMVSAQAEFNTYMNFTANMPHDFVAVDLEQYWQNWDEFNAYVKYGTPIKTIISPSLISSSTKQLCALLDNIGKPVIVYTGAAFVFYRAAPAMSWLVKYPLWYAQYYDSLSNQSSDKLIQTNFDLYKLTYPKNYPESLKNPIMWQVSSTTTIPKQPDHFDFNVFLGSDSDFEDMSRWTNSGVYKMKVKSWWLTVRSGPSISYKRIRFIIMGTIVSIYEEKNGWVRISADSQEWVNRSYLEVI